MGKSWPNNVASNYGYLFVWANLCILFILHFKSSYKLWENHGLTVSLVITDIYLCGRIYASCLSYTSNLPSPVGQKQLKCNTGIRKTI